jgi:Ni,Fe-hydrogenase I cytochrome b subunit
MSNSIKRVAVFSSAQRITHWLIALGVTFLLASAWLVQHSDVDVIAWMDWHIMVGQALSLVIIYRLYLLFVPGSGHWRLLLPTREQRHIVRQTIKFYASLGRMPCPDWFAYNPLWQPLYALVIVALVIVSGSGFLLGSSGAGMTQLHAALASFILYFTLAHIAFAVLHDVKGSGAQISAMLNGFKYFQSKPVENPLPAENSVSLQDLLKK